MGLNQNQSAKRLNVSRQYLNRVLRGVHKTVDIDVAMFLAEATGQPVDDFLAPKLIRYLVRSKKYRRLIGKESKKDEGNTIT